MTQAYFKFKHEISRNGRDRSLFKIVTESTPLKIYFIAKEFVITEIIS